MTELSRDELRRAAFVGVRWMAVARGAAEILAFATLVALAHLIPPAEFGRASIALIVPALASIVTFEASASALVQRQSIDEPHLRTATLLALALGASLGAATYLLAPLAFDPLLGRDTTNLVRLACPAFLLAGMSAVSLARLQRALDFRRISIIEVSGLAAGAVASLGLAVSGLDGKAIVLGALATTATVTALYMAAARPVRPAFDRRALNDIGGFGIPAALQALSWVGFRNVDYVIIGSRLGAAQVGYYFRAFQFGVEYQSKVSRVMVQLAFPILSRTRGTAHLNSVHGQIVRMQVTLTFPFLASLIVLAPVLVPWLLGERWSPAVVPAQILAVAGMAYVPRVATGQAVLAAGHPRPLLVFNFAALAMYAATVFVAAPHGLTVVCVAVAGAYVVLLLASYQMLLKRCLGVPFARLWDHLAPATGASVVLLAFELPVAELLGRAGAPVPMTISATTIIGLAAYGLTLRGAFPAAWGDATMLVRQALARGPGSAPRTSMAAEVAPVAAASE